MTTHVVWFRNDLRVVDHAALNHACERANTDGGVVLPIYVIDPLWFGETANGFPRVCSERIRFLLESLRDLDRHLEGIGGRLRLFFGKTADVINHICEQVAADSISFYQEVATEELSLEGQVQERVKALGVRVFCHSPSTMCDWDHLPFSIPETPEVFTKFRRLVEKRGRFSSPLRQTNVFKSIEGLVSGEQRIDEIERLPCLQVDPPSDPPDSALFFRGGITSGAERLKHYLWDTDSLSRYKQTRNGMLRVDDSSKLSSWLAFGCLSAKQVMQEVNRYESERVKNDSTYWLKFELLWRDFFIVMSAKHGANLYRSGGLQNKQIEWFANHDFIESWKGGLTGYPLVDANMRELFHTGYMSNRGRQNVASFLTKNLGVDWRIGAEWFESRLIDHDPSLNYGNWNYAAGVGNDAREFRWFNINKQAATYDPGGDYVRRWIPELAEVATEWIHRPWQMSLSLQKQYGCVLGVDYPEPIVDLFHSADVNRQRHDQAANRDQMLATQSLLKF